MVLRRSVESNHNIVFDCKYHVVFCPKYRKKVLKEPIDIRLKELFLEKAIELRAEIVEMEIMPDHVHLLIKWSAIRNSPSRKAFEGLYLESFADGI